MAWFQDSNTQHFGNELSSSWRSRDYLSLHLTQEQKFCDCGRRSNAITHSTQWFSSLAAPLQEARCSFSNRSDERKGREKSVQNSSDWRERHLRTGILQARKTMTNIYTYHEIYRKLKLSLSWSLPDLFLVPLQTAVQALTTRQSPKEHDLSAGISFKQSSSLSSVNWISISLGYRVVAGEKHPAKTWRPRKDAVRLSTGWRGQTCWPHLDATCWRKHNEILLTATSELQCND